MCIKLNLVSLVCSLKLQALRHVEARARAIVDISRLPLDSDEVFHRLQVMQVDATLEVITQILDGVEIQTLWWEVDDISWMRDGMLSDEISGRVSQGKRDKHRTDDPTVVTPAHLTS